METLQIREQLLRQIWSEQRFNSSSLRTADGRTIEVLAPGTPNANGGPDFLNARIRINETIYYGDVELHKDAGGWLDHGHETDPHYNRTILHVVLTADPIIPIVRTRSGRAIPLLILQPYVDDTLFESPFLNIVTADSGTFSPILCADINNEVVAGTIIEWLEKLGWERLELKVRRYEERLKQLIDEEKQAVREPYRRYREIPDEIPPPQQSYTRKDFASRKVWEQLLYEGIMEALGFAKNRTAFLTLARSVRLEFLRQHDLSNTKTMMALLFGAAGLLPSPRDLKDFECRRYVRPLRKRWKELRPSFKGPVLNAGDWLFFRLRPNNFPTARLATLCFSLHALFAEDSFRALIALFKEHLVTPKDLRRQLRTLFNFQPDEFWNQHYHFADSAAAPSIHLGTSRLNDIIVNVFLPAVMLYARVFGEHDVRSHVRTLGGILPPLQSNSITRKIDRELLRGRLRRNSALLQQGSIQLYRFYCSTGRCKECEVGKVVPWKQS